MEGNIENVIDMLQSIQKDLVGIIIPAIITAVVSLVTLLFNSFLSIYLQKDLQNSQQFEKMQNVYPQLKGYLQELIHYCHEAKKCKSSYSGNISSALSGYYKYRQDEIQYRKIHQSEISEIDIFILSIEKYVETMGKIFKLLNNTPIPIVPSLHCKIKKDVQSMLRQLQYWSCFFSIIPSNKAEYPLIFEELEHLSLDEKKLSIFVETLDKWYDAY